MSLPFLKKRNARLPFCLAERPFLNVSYRNERASTVVVTEGQKRLVFEPKVNSMPRAELTAW